MNETVDAEVHASDEETNLVRSRPLIPNASIVVCKVVRDLLDAAETKSHKGAGALLGAS